MKGPLVVVEGGRSGELRSPSAVVRARERAEIREGGEGGASEAPAVIKDKSAAHSASLDVRRRS